MSKLKLVQLASAVVVVALFSGAAFAKVQEKGERPSAPRDLTAKPGFEARTITLSWRGPASHRGPSILGYNIYRSEAGHTLRLVARSPNPFSYTDSELSAGNRYHYRVAAFNGREGDLSEEASAIANEWPTPSATTPGEDVALRIPAVSNSATKAVEVGSVPVVVSSLCNQELCWTRITVPGQSFTLPGSDPKDYSTPAIPMPQSCAVVVCAGPFTIPSLSYHSNGWDPITLTTPSHAEPAFCEREGSHEICRGSATVPAMTITLVPAIDSFDVTPPITIEASTTGFSGFVAPYVGEGSALLQSFVVTVPTPFGGIPVTVCPNTCQAPLSPQGELTGSVTVEMSFGDRTVSTSRAVQIAL